LFRQGRQKTDLALNLRKLLVIRGRLNAGLRTYWEDLLLTGLLTGLLAGLLAGASSPLSESSAGMTCFKSLVGVSYIQRRWTGIFATLQTVDHEWSGLRGYSPSSLPGWRPHRGPSLAASTEILISATPSCCPLCSVRHRRMSLRHHCR